MQQLTDKLAEVARTRMKQTRVMINMPVNDHKELIYFFLCLHQFGRAVFQSRHLRSYDVN